MSIEPDHNRVRTVSRNSRVVFTHTEVDPAYEGSGVGSALARFALD